MESTLLKGCTKAKASEPSQRAGKRPARSARSGKDLEEQPSSVRRGELSRAWELLAPPCQPEKKIIILRSGTALGLSRRLCDHRPARPTEGQAAGQISSVRHGCKRRLGVK
mmetsp:Transcript_104902/g.301615  ORF Transcript_104902/g.301615 Transcript_104902/m.301615 type:complete len:111 (-) Transcript_104902:4-336(-)